MSQPEWLDYDDDEDISLSFPSTFAEFFSSQLRDSLRDGLNEIGEIWLTMGIPPNKRDEKIDTIRTNFIEYAQKLVDNERQLLENCRNFREYKLNEINKILRDLSFEPFVVPTDKSLVAQNKLLHLKYKELIEVKNERLDQLERINEKLQKVCTSLGIEYKEEIFATNIPSEPELMTLRSILMDQQKNLCNSKIQFEAIKGMFSKFLSELEFTTDDDTEKMLIESTKDNFIFSKKNMSLLMDFQKNLVNLYNSSKNEILKLTEHLEQLYVRLDIDAVERKEFNHGTLPQIKKRLLAEIEKYEIIKKNSMEKIIKSIRSDLCSLFDKCLVAEFDEDLIKSNDFTEELLIRHEKEFEKLNGFFKAYENVFQKLKDWEESMEKLIELEKKSTDPNRFTNRGGMLLQNERDRKMLEKKLPRLEKDIRSMIAVIETKECIPFTMYGFNADHYFEVNWNHFSQSKSSVKKSSSVKKISDSGKKSAQKPRVPLSPRVNNQTKRSAASQNLFNRNVNSSNGKKMFDANELEFQKFVQQKDLLHSTMLENSDEIPSKLPKLFDTPTTITFRKKALRRLSKSCDDLTKLPSLNINRIVSSKLTRPIEIPTKKPRFLP